MTDINEELSKLLSLSFLSALIFSANFYHTYYSTEAILHSSSQFSHAPASKPGFPLIYNDPLTSLWNKWFVSFV